MVARLTFTAAGRPVALTLDSALVWSGPEPYASDLNLLAGAVTRSPALGDWSVRVARAAAELTGGTLEFAPRPEPEPGLIY